MYLFMLSVEVLKSASGFALLASAPALISWAQDNVNADVIGQSVNRKLHVSQKRAAKITENSSFLLKFIWYALLTVAGLYILGFLEKGIVLLKNGLELRMNEDFVKYREDEDELSNKKRTLNSKKLELGEIQGNKKNFIKEKEKLEKEVENLKNDPDLELLRPYINAVKNIENEKLVKIFELRQALKDFYRLTLGWTDQNGFRMEYPSFEKIWRGPLSPKANNGQLKWLDEFIAKVGDPLSWPEKMLGTELKKFQGKQYLFYSGRSLTFYFNSFKDKNVQQLSEEDFNGAQKELTDIKETYINDYNSDEEFKRKCDEYSEGINKFKKNFENFKKAQKRLEEIKKLRESYRGDLFSYIYEVNTVEEEIKGKLKSDIERKECLLQKLKRKLSDNDSKEKSLEEDIANTEGFVKQLEKKLGEMKDIKEKIENMKKKEREIDDDGCKFTLPGSYTLFY